MLFEKYTILSMIFFAIIMYIYIYVCISYIMKVMYTYVTLYNKRFNINSFSLFFKLRYFYQHL